MIKNKEKEFISIQMVIGNVIFYYSYDGEFVNDKKEGQGYLESSNDVL